MTTSIPASHQTETPSAAGPSTQSPDDLLPGRRTLLLLACAYSALFVGVFATGGGEGPKATSPGTTVISEYTQSSGAVAVSGYLLVVVAALLIFWGASVRRLLSRAGGDWTAEAAFAGTVAMALTLVGWAVTAFALHDAVRGGTPEVAQAMNVLDHANFVPAMLGLVCTMVGTGLASYRLRALPRWLAIASVVIGLLAPLGPGGFVPFSLFPVWVIVVSAMIRRPD